TFVRLTTTRISVAAIGTSAKLARSRRAPATASETPTAIKRKSGGHAVATSRSWISHTIHTAIDGAAQTRRRASVCRDGTDDGGAQPAARKPTNIVAATALLTVRPASNGPQPMPDQPEARYGRIHVQAPARSAPAKAASRWRSPVTRSSG